MATLTGTTGSDTLSGFVPSDLLEGLGGNDTLYGGRGNDTLYGGTGNDRLVSGPGFDYLFGGGGNDLLDLTEQDAGGVSLGGVATPGLGRDTVLGSLVQYDAGRGIELSYRGLPNVGGITVTFDGPQGTGTVTSNNGGAIADRFAGVSYVLGTDNSDTFNAAYSRQDSYFVGYRGWDTFNGSEGFDWVLYSAEPSERTFGQGVVVKLSENRAFGQYGEVDKLYNIDGVRGTALGDVLSGDDRRNILLGDDGRDGLYGGGGSDTLYGGAGDDWLYGGAGRDWLYGGAGNGMLDGGDGARDGAVFDNIEISDFDWLTVDLQENTWRIGNQFPQSSRAVSGQIEGVENIYATARNDILSGDDAENWLYGLDGDDILTGRGGNDALVGGKGNDTLYGGEGQDYILGGEGNDLIDVSEGDISSQPLGDQVHPGLGRDTIIGNQQVWAAGNGVDISYEDITGVGGLTFSLAPDGSGTVRSADLRINDTYTYTHALTGSLQGDVFNVSDGPAIGTTEDAYIVLLGNAGSDRFNGSDRLERVDYSLEYLWGGTAGVTVLLNSEFGYDAFGSIDFYSDIDDAMGTDQADRLQGGATANELTGLDGDDTLSGGSGNDTLIAGAGDDTVNGDAGDDTIELDYDLADLLDVTEAEGVLSLHHWTGIDRVTTVETFAFADQTLSLSELRMMLPEAGRDVSGSGRLTGGTGDDTLTGSAGADVLDGGRGADTMSGGQGNDFYFVNNPGDVITGEIAFSQGGGIDTVRAFIDFVQPDNIELVRLGNIDDTDDLNAVGNDAPGTLVGNAGDNSLTGRGGDDQLNGNDGDDVIIGNTGRDTLVGGAGADTFVYGSISESRAGAATRDLINGFDRGAVQDRIDLAGIDANTRTFGVDDAFDFVGAARFTGTAGELRTQGLGGANAVVIEGDINGDGVADFQIFVNLQTSMQAGDFSL